LIRACKERHDSDKEKMKDVEMQLSRLRRHLTEGALLGLGDKARLKRVYRVPRCRYIHFDLQLLVLSEKPARYGPGLVPLIRKNNAESASASTTTTQLRENQSISPPSKPSNAPSLTLRTATPTHSPRFGLGGWDPFALQFKRMKKS
jgi:hypothetical protein